MLPRPIPMLPAENVECACDPGRTLDPQQYPRGTVWSTPHPNERCHAAPWSPSTPTATRPTSSVALDFPHMPEYRAMSCTGGTVHLVLSRPGFVLSGVSGSTCCSVLAI